MLLMGDIHGLFWDYKNKLRKSKAKESLQLGDYGLGFPDTMDGVDLSDIGGTHLFLRGNHDNPAICRKSPYYIGDYGIRKGSFMDGKYDKLFYISGAWSIDSAYRLVDVSWWADEELSYTELNNAYDVYYKENPKIVCSHDCPALVLNELYPSRVILTRTGQAMDAMFQSHKPDYWFFGHHHRTFRKKIAGTTFVCLNELETIDISKPINFLGGL